MILVSLCAPLVTDPKSAETSREKIDIRRQRKIRVLLAVAVVVGKNQSSKFSMYDILPCAPILKPLQKLIPPGTQPCRNRRIPGKSAICTLHSAIPFPRASQSVHTSPSPSLVSQIEECAHARKSAHHSLFPSNTRGESPHSRSMPSRWAPACLGRCLAQIRETFHPGKSGTLELWNSARECWGCWPVRSLRRTPLVSGLRVCPVSASSPTESRDVVRGLVCRPWCSCSCLLLK